MGDSDKQRWIHPAGFVDVATLEEIRRKIRFHDWAKKAAEELRASVQPWLEQPLDRIETLMPKRKMQVYWLMICPVCQDRLRFEPFNDREATCRRCDVAHVLHQQSTAVHLTGKYSGTLYEGWGCSYIQAMATTAQHLALLYALGGDRSYAERSAGILKLFARHIQTLPVQGSGTQHVIWTYNMEGDCVIVLALSEAYELLRLEEGLFTAQEHLRIRQDLLRHWADAVFRVEEDSSPRHNGMFAYLSSVAMAGCAIESTDYVDWAFGHRDYASERRPDHRGIRWLTRNNYLADGGFWGLCSAYHLYALGPNCRALVLGHRLSRQMPDLFPSEIYDELDSGNSSYRHVRRAIKWFTAQTFPDLSVAPTGDMGGRASLASYPLTAEIGYRYLDIDETGSYRVLREGDRGLTGLLFGAEVIKEKPVPYQSANLSSGYVALKRESGGNRLYAGLNALLPGSGHAHADRMNLITYSHDRMLTGEKRTRYEDPDQRIYSGASYAHNTVTVDEVSQVHGDQLRHDQVPRIHTFVDLPGGQVAEAHGDREYEPTDIYRRILIQFDSYLLDIFRVRGGNIHDWFYHGIGEEPQISLAMKEKTGFEPADYVMRGRPGFREGRAEETFQTTWRVPAEPETGNGANRNDVSNRVTVSGSPEQTAFLLNTYPDPGRHSLMVRHRETDAPFVAVHEAYIENPFVSDVRMLPGDAAAVVHIAHADGGSRQVVYESGSGPDGLMLAGRFASVSRNASGQPRSIILVHTTEFSCSGIRIRSARPVTLSAVFDGDTIRMVSCPSVAYQTLEGRPVYKNGQDVDVFVERAPDGARAGRKIEARLPGQTGTGPVPIELTR
ncbi:MAG: heparinase II/III family protein [Gemmatimonadota bacterium]|nr:heparinase II/III family protein [Gemmatimonadota bacterium]